MLVLNYKDEHVYLVYDNQVHVTEIILDIKTSFAENVFHFFKATLQSVS